MCVCVCVCVCVCMCVCVYVCVCARATSARSCDRCNGSSGDDMEGVVNAGMLCVCVCTIPGV